jgi:phospholipase C
LEKAGVCWKVYQHLNDSEGFNMLRSFTSFQNADKSSPLYTKGIAASSEGQFEYDALNDKLPTFSWLCPTYTTSEHPRHLPADGADFIAGKIDAIAANPDVWAKTAFILNYDENDGLFDHVAPPVPPPGTPHEFVNGLPIGGGFRVPCIIVSPWTTGGWVCSEPFDHTSVLQFLEKFTGVIEPNISDWRRQTFGDLTSAFRFQQASEKAPSLPGTTGPLQLARYTSAHLPAPSIPEANQKLPEQEKGTRKRTATLKN